MSLVEKQDPDLHDLPKNWPKVLLQSDMFQVELRDVLYKPQSGVERSTEILDLLNFSGLPGHDTALCADVTYCLSIFVHGHDPKSTAKHIAFLQAGSMPEKQK